MKTDLIWKSWDGTQIENVYFTENDSNIEINSATIGMNKGVPIRIFYEINCDLKWKVNKVTVNVLGLHSWNITLLSYKNGQWVNECGEQVNSLNGCLDIDISATPFTNTLPINRLGLGIGEAREIKVVYIDAYNFKLKSVRQRYTCLEANANGYKYRYENLESNFSAEFFVDRQGLIIDYPDLFKRECITIY